MLIAKLMVEINEKTMTKGASFVSNTYCRKDSRSSRRSGADAAIKELDQLHKRNCFTPVDIAEMTKEERRKAQEALMFLTEKRDKSVKGRMVYNGKPTREWLSREDCCEPNHRIGKYYAHSYRRRI